MERKLRALQAGYPSDVPHAYSDVHCSCSIAARVFKSGHVGDGSCDT